MEVLFSGQVPKDPDFPADIEDAPVLQIGDSRIILSDGASESFDSRTWARLVSENVGQHREPLEQSLEKAIASYAASFDFSALSWSKQAAFLRGSFATLLLIDYLPESNSVRVLSVGDTLAVLLEQGELVSSHPYSDAVEFQQRPDLLSTRPELNTFLSNPEFSVLHEVIWSLAELEEPVVLGMTDALGEWALRHEEDGVPAWRELRSLTAAHQLQQLVFRERQTNAMRKDDVTLVQLSFPERQEDELPDPRTIQRGFAEPSE